MRPTTLRYGSIYTNRVAASTVGLLDAAILVADVVDYNRLAGVDEEGTLARLRALRSDLINPAIAVHKGRVVKRTGDGLLAEFRRSALRDRTAARHDRTQCWRAG